MAKGDWKPAPKGPPPRAAKGKGRYSTLMLWLDDHPGEWAVIEDTNAAQGSSLRRRGYETHNVYRYDDKNRCDVYIRKPTEREEQT